MARGSTGVAGFDATSERPEFTQAAAPLRIEQGLSRFAQRKWLVIVLAGAISLGARALLLPVVPIPKPAIQDEFSYLLASDTFASGRLTNPTPPCPEHFESPQVILHPTYASKYPPFSAMVMALGQKLTGQPWVGVWLAMGVFCATLCWAIQGWLPPMWAMFGTLIAILRIGVVSYWTESYWGGTCAAIGGALLIGAVPRLIRRPRARVAVAFAIGLAIVANTRPYEGVVMAAVCIGCIAVGLARTGRLAHAARAVIVPIALVLIPLSAWMCYYNYRVTGSALKLPYMAHEELYVVWSPLLWETHPKPEPTYTSSTLRDFWLIADRGEKQFSRDHLLKAHGSDLLQLGRFLLGWPLILCAAGFARPLWRDRTARAALLLAGAFYAGAAFDARLFPHYAAPAATLAYIIAASALRAARNSWPGASVEQLYVTAGIFALFAVVTVLAWLSPQNRYLFADIDYHVRAKHATVAEQLAKVAGDHLVLVHYGPHHDLYEELVYNQADIAHSRFIWARSLGEARDQVLIRQYAGRKVWWLEEDGTSKLTAYADQYNSYYYQPLRWLLR